MKLILPFVLALISSACVLVPADSPGAKSGSSSSTSAKSGGSGSSSGGNAVVCHKGQTKELPQEAVPAHIGHGDRHGPC